MIEIFIQEKISQYEQLYNHLYSFSLKKQHNLSFFFNIKAFDIYKKFLGTVLIIIYLI